MKTKRDLTVPFVTYTVFVPAGTPVRRTRWMTKKGERFGYTVAPEGALFNDLAYYYCFVPASEVDHEYIEPDGTCPYMVENQIAAIIGQPIPKGDDWLKWALLIRSTDDSASPL